MANGLLSTVATTNADKSGEILVDIARIAIEGFKIAAGGPGMKIFQIDHQAKEVEVIFDPTNDQDYEEAKADLRDTANLELDMDRPDIASFGAWTNLAATEKPAKFDGFFYRSVLPYTITVYHAAEKSRATKMLLLPNDAPILSFSPQRTPMVERVTSISLENGTLTDVYVSKPSTWQAAVKVPLSILQAIVALPTELVQLKFNYSTANAGLLKSQKVEIDTLREILEV